MSESEKVDLSVPQSVSRGHAAALARLITARIGRDLAGIPLSRTAQFFRRDRSSLAKGLERLEERIQSDRQLRGRIARLTRRFDNTTIRV